MIHFTLLKDWDKDHVCLKRIIAILMEVKEHVTVILFCILLMTTVLFVTISSLENVYLILCF